jgi:hypothetical protein
MRRELSRSMGILLASIGIVVPATLNNNELAHLKTSNEGLAEWLLNPPDDATQVVGR